MKAVLELHTWKVTAQFIDKHKRFETRLEVRKVATVHETLNLCGGIIMQALQDANPRYLIQIESMEYIGQTLCVVPEMCFLKESE